MHPNAQLLTGFYEAFQRQDAAAMAACYHPDAHFTDPVFPELRGDGPGDMWKMLCAQASDLRIAFSGIEADDAMGKAHWEAWYPFGPGKRPVHNVIDASFTFQDGKILRHIDTFDFWRWSRMALGAPGVLLGWSSFLQGKVQAQAGKGLAKFQAGG